MKSRSRFIRITVILCSFIFLLPINLYSQNKITSTISVNVFGLPFNDFSLYYDVTKNESERFGLSVGYMVAFKWWENTENLDYSSDDDKLPMGAYNGPQLRLYYEFVKRPYGAIRFKGPEIILKYLHYSNQTFEDGLKDDHDKRMYFTRSEKAFVIGVEWLWGRGYQHGRLFYEIFWGIGGRLKIRDINTTDHHSQYSELVERYRPLGKKHTTLFIPTINLGLKLGTWVSGKKQAE